MFLSASCVRNAWCDVMMTLGIAISPDKISSFMILYEKSSRSFIFNNILIIFNLFIYLGFSISLSETTFFCILFLLFISYFLVSKYVVPKFVNFLVKSKISTDTINKLDFLSCFLLIFILIKIYLL